MHEAVGHDGIQQVLVGHILLDGGPGHVQLPLLLVVPDGLQDHLGVLGVRLRTGGLLYLSFDFGRHLGFDYDGLACSSVVAVFSCCLTSYDRAGLKIVREVQLLSIQSCFRLDLISRLQSQILRTTTDFNPVLIYQIK